MGTGSGERLRGRLGNDDEQEAGHHGGEVHHPDAGHELADGGQDRLRDLVHDLVKGIAGIEGYPGEDDPQENGGYQNVGQDRDEQGQGFDGLSSQALGLFVGGLDGLSERGP